MKKPTEVRYYSGHTHAERPHSFLWDGQIREVEKIEKAGQEPGKRHFRVRTQDDNLFELCYHELRDEWSVIDQ